VKIRFELMITCSNTIINYRLSKKFKIGNCKYNHVTIIPIVINSIVVHLFTVETMVTDSISTW
jgi:hypothetical protein